MDVAATPQVVQPQPDNAVPIIQQHEEQQVQPQVQDIPQGEIVQEEIHQPQAIQQQQLPVVQLVGPGPQLPVANVAPVDVNAQMINVLLAMQQKIDQDRVNSQQALNQLTEQLKGLKASPTIQAKMDPTDHFSGVSDESVEDWIRKVNRRASNEGWSEQDKKKAAVNALTGQALTWNDLVGKVFQDWSSWSENLIETFSVRLTDSQWSVKVEARKQSKGESRRSYVMDKVIILRQRTI